MDRGFLLFFSQNFTSSLQTSPIVLIGYDEDSLIKLAGSYREQPPWPRPQNILLEHRWAGRRHFRRSRGLRPIQGFSRWPILPCSLVHGGNGSQSEGLTEVASLPRSRLRSAALLIFAALAVFLVWHTLALEELGRRMTRSLIWCMSVRHLLSA